VKILSIATLGGLVRDQRKSFGLTQVEAAGLCGVGERFLRELEHGKSTLEIGRVLRVLSSLGIELTARVREP